MSKHDVDKYPVAAVKMPEAFRITHSVSGGCLGCNDDIHKGDWCMYVEGKLYHEECGEDEWELGL